MVSRSDASKQSPAMAQYHRWKAEHPDEILFFQMGDFFEMFFEDARTVSKALGLTLTSRSKGADAIPMAGVPVKSVHQYLKRLVAQGFRVAICDQIEDPRQADAVVDRAVTRIVTAGTLTEDDLLDRGRPNFLAALAPAAESRAGLALVDLSTGEFRVHDAGKDRLLDLLGQAQPAEILLPEGAADLPLAREVRLAAAGAVTPLPDWQFGDDSARQVLLEHYHLHTLEGLGLPEQSPAVAAAGAALRYLGETQKTRLDHLDPPRLDPDRGHLTLDRATRSCLELLETAREGRKEGSLLRVLDQTVTALGARCMREWLLRPLVEVERIRERQDAVAELVDDRRLRLALRDRLAEVADLERLLTRAVTNRANARDLASVRASLQVVPVLRELLAPVAAGELARRREALDPLPQLTSLLERALVDEPPLALVDGGVIRDGYHEELDELRALDRDGRRFILSYQTEEVTRTGIQNLKVGFNRVFGFYIEITNSFRDRIPGDYIRKQTLKNAERYITPRLKEFETKVLHAEERAREIEVELFQKLRQEVAAAVEPLKRTAAALAELDCLQALAHVAALNGYVRPVVDDGDVLHVEGGRHPVLAESLGASAFVPNDCRMERARRRLAVVTGPNMAGKSTYIRQIALIQIMAQMGGFVPARRARLFAADRVFARVGAADDLTRGSSTFMLEMSETANILNNATARSLVILDEVGRGTSTFDGLALAWAISEHLLDKLGCVAFFATHYHQLMDLATTFPAVVNLNVAVREWGDEIVFLHQIVEGGSDRSYGIHVARLAGIPKAVLERAARILRELEENHPDLRPRGAASRTAAAGGGGRPRLEQKLLFEPPEKRLAGELLALDPDQTSPLAALAFLAEWRRKLGG